MLVGILLDATSSDFDVSFDFYGKMDGFSEFRYGSGAGDELVEMIVASVVGGGAEKERFGEVDLRKGWWSRVRVVARSFATATVGRCGDGLVVVVVVVGVVRGHVVK